MRFKRNLSLLLVLICLLSAVPFPALAVDGQTPVLTDSGQAEAALLADPYVYCRGACLIDRNSGRVLYTKDANARVYPASTTKIMTALLCLKYGNLDDYVTIYSSDYNSIYGRNASSAGFYVGEYLSIHTLLKGMLVVSGCDAACVIARYVGGNEANFVDMMNREAQALGCTGTHFTSPHGLHDDNHYTTARDMTLIAAAAMEYPAFRDIVKRTWVTLPETNKHYARTLTNTNLLLPGASEYYAFQDCIGVKTGTTGEAGSCLVSAANRNGVELILAMFGAPSLDTRYEQSRTLLEWGFSVDHDRSIQGAAVTLSQTEYMFDGSAHTPETTVQLDGKTLALGTDYTVSYASNVQAGTGTVQIGGIGNYYGNITAGFTVKSPLPFLDVPTDYWAFPVIRAAYEEGIVNGRPFNQFAPLDPVTRAEAVTLLHRVLGSPQAGQETTFTDVPRNYAYAAISWAQEAGVIQGKTETEFDPDAPVTRQELAAMLYRTGAYATRDPAILEQFADRDQVSGFAETPLVWAVQERLLRGRETVDQLLLAPLDSANRAEVTAVMLRFRDWYAVQEHLEDNPESTPEPEITPEPETAQEPAPEQDEDPEPAMAA